MLAERDAIQANLLELDGSFVKQLLEGAALTGQTRQRWDAAAATLAGLWETYLAYSAVVDRIAELGAARRRPAKQELAELTALLTGGCVQLAGRPGRRWPAGTWPHRAPPVTLATAVGAMRRSFTEVDRGDLGRRDGLGRGRRAARRGRGRAGPSRPLRRGLGDETEAAFARRQAALDPAAGRAQRRPAGAAGAAAGVDTSAADRLRAQAAALAARIAELTGCGRRPGSRIDGARGRGRGRPRRPRRTRSPPGSAPRRGSRPLPPPPPELADPPLASLAALAGGGPWTGWRPSLTAARPSWPRPPPRPPECGGAAAALASRDELRGLLGAYKAKAARLGAAEDAAAGRAATTRRATCSGRRRATWPRPRRRCPATSRRSWRRRGRR